MKRKKTKHRKVLTNQNSFVPKPTVRIETFRGRKRIYINGKLMQSYWDGPTEIPFRLIKDIEFKDLVGVTDIIILYAKKDNDDHVLTEYMNSEIQYEFVLDVVDEVTINAFVTVFDNLEDAEHDKYQLKLEEVIKENPELTTYGSVHMGFEEMIANQERLEEYEKDTGIHIPFSPVGCVQFSVDLHGFFFKDLYKPLHRLITSLDKETRHRLQKEENEND